jgi:hypothetical protein
LALNVVQSVELKYPFTLPVEAGIDTVLVFLASGAEKVITFSLPLKVVQSVEDRYPAMLPEDVGTLAVVAEVARPLASKTMTGMADAEPTEPATTPEVARVGFGYVPVRSPPAVPVGGAPVATIVPVPVAVMVFPEPTTSEPVSSFEPSFFF